MNRATLQAYLSSYQDNDADVHLRLQELQAIPFMLRLALLQRLSTIAVDLCHRMSERSRASHWTEQLRTTTRADPTHLVHVVASMARNNPTLSPSWVAEFRRGTQQAQPNPKLTLVWLDQQLELHHTSLGEMLELESRAQTNAQVAAGNCIGSLRMIARADWTKISETLSVVDNALRDDPAGVYAHMDAVTRQRYRRAVAFMAHHGRGNEQEITQYVLLRAQTAAPSQANDDALHVGYWLIGTGRRQIEQQFNVRLPPRMKLWRVVQRAPFLIYALPILMLTAAIALLAWPSVGHFGVLHASVVFLALVLAASHLSVALVNWAVTLDIPTHILPRLDLSSGVPERLCTLVVVPCLLNSVEQADKLIKGLELRYLGNRSANIFFGLLSDFADATEQTTAADARLLAATVTGIQQLNARYASDSPPRFFLMHRTRTWNPRDRIWMGWERKRGKLIALNRFLRGRAPADVQLSVGTAAALRRAVYVITLDADTQLPPETAARLIATMAHPLNRPVWDAHQHRIVRGYGVLQPLISVGASRHGGSLLAHLYSNEIALDPYTGVVSDVYQDLFGEASFVGKGIYDVDAFMWATGTRFPENRILSHDLLEGSYARTGLVSDIELFEHFPDNYGVEVNRRRRWTRGDWQLLPWLSPWTPGPRGHWLRCGLCWHHRLKLLDNLRRSLVPAALLVLLVDGWLFSGSPMARTALVLLVLFVSPLLISLRDLALRDPHMDQSLHLRLCLEATRRRLAQAALPLAMLPFETWQLLDAIVRSLWRQFASHKNLLQWIPASAVARTAPRRVRDFYRLMWPAPVFGIVLACGAALRGGSTLAVAAPLLLLWCAAPWLGWRLSQLARTAPEEELDAAARRWLRVIARRTWHFFEILVTAREHELPPDNFQEYPAPITAHRTSPTNVGLYLTSVLSARDFGYLTGSQLQARVALTLATLERLPRYRGHFYNWYDTRTLTPLPPAYVSTVDSGNLLACLYVVARGLEEIEDAPVLPAQAWRGLRDTWQVLHDACTQQAGSFGKAQPSLDAMGKLLQDSAPVDVSLCAQSQVLAALMAHADDALSLLPGTAATAHPSQPDGGATMLVQPHQWLQSLRNECQAWQDELRTRAPWLHFANSSVQWPSPMVALLARLDANPPQHEAVALAQCLCHTLREPTPDGPAAALTAALQQTIETAFQYTAQAQRLAERCRALCDVDFSFLYAEDQRLLAIGYNADTQQRDAGCYDLLASEARLGSFVAIAQGRLPQQHWLALGRLLVAAGDGTALASWGGTMFEYLMPLLLMPSTPNTLLTRSCRNVIQAQIDYGKELGMPWGISESAYNVTDTHYAYQYRTFGVPGLGLRHGLAHDQVVAPYASALALLLTPTAACRNLHQLADLGALGCFGFYEALDFTPGRIGENARFAIVRTFMAHHQGMILTALSGALNGNPLQRRFAREPMFRAYQLLLQERIPAAIRITRNTLQAALPPRREANDSDAGTRTITQLDGAHPQLQLLSNGRYHSLISQAGGGFNQWHDLLVNRWQADATCDTAGLFCYIQDLDTGHLWSNSWQPTAVAARDYQATFGAASAEFVRTDHGINTRTRIAVSAEDDIELRRITLSNQSHATRRIAVTSYLEVALLGARDASAHPAFDKLFVETEYVPAQQALLARRRPRDVTATPPVLLHLMATAQPDRALPSYETRRDVFIGRCGSTAAPAALADGAPLHNFAGAALDPIAALRREIVLAPGATQTLDLVTGVGADRDAALALAARYADGRLAKRVFDMAWTRARVLHYQLDIGAQEQSTFARLLSCVLYPYSTLRVASGLRDQPRGGRMALWKFGISGDLPIVLLRAASTTDYALVQEVLQAHRYWHAHGQRVDLVIWGDGRHSYRQPLRDRIMQTIGLDTTAQPLDGAGGVHVQYDEALTQADRTLLLAAAAVVLDGHGPSLAEQLPARDARADHAEINRQITVSGDFGQALQPPALQLFNGHGGWSPDSSEYQIWLPAGVNTPAPWANVLANETFGSVVSESGGAYTWSQNAHELRLTPWYNDPVTDASGEAFYLRDDHSGVFWSPTPQPARGALPYLSAHGFGYSRFETVQHGMASVLTVFVAADAPVKFSVLRLHNQSSQTRTLSVFGYVEWVLGEQRTATAPHLVTRCDPKSRVILASNPFNDAWPGATGWFAAGWPEGRSAHGATLGSDAAASGSRTAFIGRNRGLRDPRALLHARLESHFGAGMDPCGAWQVPVVLAPDETCEIVFLLGCATDANQARALTQQWANAPAAAEQLQQVRERWRDRLGRIAVRTPEPATNLLLNGWLAYQVIACRLWGRSGYYQSGGAFGFRDQLQDTVALLALEPALARAQILRAASRQFEEGDVQHWWHPPQGRGVRTHFSDDYLWLPWAVAQYLQATSDDALLDESVSFLHARPLQADEESCYESPQTSDQTASVYEHCQRALERAMAALGRHGLPLMGGGDWNDGMNRVGAQGRGESVWLGMFLTDILRQFAPVAAARGDADFAHRCIATADALACQLEQHAWDGRWYLRAWMDDGTPLGSQRNDACQIDSLPQSWSVLANVGSPERRRRALDAALQRLVHPADRVIQLFDPPFDSGTLDPGYIKGYLPGTRENGGQYTHAAVWLGMACAKLGRADQAWQVFELISPVAHTRNAAQVATYKTEPYVVAADVYWTTPHRGRGGWSWYTGSAGWLYRFGLHSLLGLQPDRDGLIVDPCVPHQWQEYEVRWQYRSSVYHISFIRDDMQHIETQSGLMPAPWANDQTPEQQRGGSSVAITLDGRPVPGRRVALVDDGNSHTIRVRFATRAPSA